MPDMTAWSQMLPRLVANPSLAQAASLSQLEEVLKGTADVTDPTNPAIFVMSNSAVNAAALLTSFETYTRRAYPGMAVTPDDLYIHMSDVDYLNRFAIPAHGTFFMLLSYEEVLSKLVATHVNGIKKLMIPRFTELTVGGAAFTMQHAIEIRQNASGGIQVVYNQDDTSPIDTLTTNMVPWEVVTLYETIGASKGPVSFLQLTVPMHQMAIASHIVKYDRSSGVNNIFAYTDQFYYARAFLIGADGSLTEIKTTHTDQTFDPTAVTLVLQDLGGSLRVTLPQVYLTNRMAGDEIQLDIYTTKGDITLELGAYNTNQYAVKWNGALPADTPYVSPMTAITTMAFYAKDPATGGANGVPFSTLRANVMANNYGPVNLPITTNHLSAALTNKGYQSVLETDQVTGRIILGTRELPPQVNGTVISGASMAIETLMSSTDVLGNLGTVNPHGDRLTILPSTLYRLKSGQLSIVTDTERQSLLSMGNDALVGAINANTFLYAPFHYVVDTSDNQLDLRAYQFADPEVISLQFDMENPNSGFGVGTQSFTLIPSPTGYTLRLQCRSTQSWKDLQDSACFCQLAFTPAGEKTLAYLNGTLVGTQNGERVYEFDLTTEFDVDGNDNLVLTSFQMFNDAKRQHAIALEADLTVFWAATGISGSDAIQTTIDTTLGTVLLPQGVLGLTQETLKVSLGDALPNLWRRSRTVAGPSDYQTYPANVPLLYTTDVYERDPVSGQVQFTVANGNIVMTKLHSAGDPVLDAQSNPVMLHKAGDQVLDSHGKPILNAPGTLTRQLDLLLVEGVYYFATQADAKAYAQSVATTLTTWISQDFGDLSQSLLEETSLFFYPKVALGNLNVMTQSGIRAVVSAQQSFTVNYYLSTANWRDISLRQPLSDAAKSVISQALNQKTVTMQALNATLSASVGSDVVGFDVNGLGGATPLTAATIMDDSSQFSVKKIAVAEPDGTIGVADDITVAFIAHNTNY